MSVQMYTGSTVLIEKSTGTQLFTKLHTIYVTWKIITTFTKARYWSLSSTQWSKPASSEEVQYQDHGYTNL